MYFYQKLFLRDIIKLLAFEIKVKLHCCRYVNILQTILVVNVSFCKTRFDR